MNRLMIIIPPRWGATFYDLNHITTVQHGSIDMTYEGYKLGFLRGQQAARKERWIVNKSGRLKSECIRQPVPLAKNLQTE